MLTEKSIIGSIQVLEDGQIQVRRDDIILRDGVEISRVLHRHVIVPGQDTSSQDPRVVAVCKALHTPEVVEAYELARSA
jgi:hypothetical protein